MKYFFVFAFWAFAVGAQAEEEKIYLLSKRQALNSTYTHVVFFYDQEIESIPSCQRDIVRGRQNKWRYYHHKFKKPKGYSQKTSYYCIKSKVNFREWYDGAPYSHIYQIDIRSEQTVIKEMRNYSECLRNLRKTAVNEEPRFFCAKLSQEQALGS